MRHRYAKTIEWLSPAVKQGTIGSKTSDWSGQRQTAKAVISAPTGTLAAAMYGLESRDVVTLTLPKNCPITENCGVWLDDPTTPHPWGIAVSVRRYPLHTEADVKRAVLR
jgi:hypothetical protein